MAKHRTYSNLVSLDWISERFVTHFRASAVLWRGLCCGGGCAARTPSLAYLALRGFLASVAIPSPPTLCAAGVLKAPYQRSDSFTHVPAVCAAGVGCEGCRTASHQPCVCCQGPSHAAAGDQPELPQPRVQPDTPAGTKMSRAPFSSTWRSHWV